LKIEKYKSPYIVTVIKKIENGEVSPALDANWHFMMSIRYYGILLFLFGVDLFQDVSRKGQRG